LIILAPSLAESKPLVNFPNVTTWLKEVNLCQYSGLTRSLFHL